MSCLPDIGQWQPQLPKEVLLLPPTRTTTVLLTAGLVTLLGVPGAAAAEPAPSALYVNRAAANCTDGGPGSQAVPFCSISKAAKVVEPGQTVWVDAAVWHYKESVTIDRSGEPGKPITFDIIPGEPDPDTGEVSDTYATDGLTISGASHVVVRGLTTDDGIRVHASTDVALDGIGNGWGQIHGLVVGGGSEDVRVTRSRLHSARVEGGSRNTLFGRNTFFAQNRLEAAEVVDAPGTVLTNNTVYSGCKEGIGVSGGSTGSKVFNNLIYPADYCSNFEPFRSIGVSESAAAGTAADYNLITGGLGQNSPVRTPYQWAGTGYRTPAEFTAATGQGAHDIVVASRDGVGAHETGSPTVDSGDPTAPGVLPTDIHGGPTADDPRVPNTGRDGGWIDRGAEETQDRLSMVWSYVSQNNWAPVGTAVGVNISTDSNWQSTLTYHVDFGDGTAPVVSKKNFVEHVYSAPGVYDVKTKVVTAVGREVPGSTRTTKVTAPGTLAAGFTAVPVLPTTVDTGNRIAPLTVRIDTPGATVAPWRVGSQKVDFGDGTTSSRKGLEKVDHAYKTPGTYTVTVSLTDVQGATSTATKTVQVDYAPSGYVATEPLRVLDTRTTNTPIRGGSAHPVAVVGWGVPDYGLSRSVSAVVLNVTVTDATEDTHLTVWPSGQSRPATSNVNIARGGTSSNTVTVPVGADGKIQAQLNAGKAALIVDVVGYYQPNVGERFSPLTPTRVTDTRTSGGALGGGKTRTVKVAGVNGIPADAKAVALNLTGTGATQPAHVIAYPDPAKRPATSNLNVEPGKDKSNQAIVPVGPNGTITLFTNSGSTHLVLDAVGYYGKDGKALFTPVVPKRLADTRTTGKVAPGATTTVSGLPANALGAVLNVTATDSAGPGFLTAYAFGGTLPGASSLNTLPGVTVPNHVTTPVGAGGKVSIFNSHGGPNHVITDLLGYFTAK
ncbi:PKD domain-containing protein [Streptomyces sp. NPDC002812]|uniref:PKD domain-containing protein n=1 Tax=Streptomyces sp. NPDC002812 TaxID=3154434 RepID=UPI003317C484